MTFAIASTTGSGTVSIQADSKNVTGSGAAFTSALQGRIFFVGSQWGIVQSVTDTATLTLDRRIANAVSGAAWRHAATTAKVTQSGTDTSCAGLASVPGITVFAPTAVASTLISPKKIYNFNGLCLEVTGTFTYNANLEEPFFDASTIGNCVLVKSGATFELTSAINMGIAGLTAVTTYQTALSSARSPVGSFNLPNNYILNGEAGSTVNLTGVTIAASLNIFIYGGGTCKDSVFLGGGTATPLAVVGSNTYVVDDLYIVGMQGLVHNQNNKASIKGLKVRSANATSQHDGTGWTTPSAATSYATYQDYPSAGGSTWDFRYWWNGGYKVVNSATGSALRCTSNTTSADTTNRQYGNGFTMVTRDVSFTLSSPGTPVTSGVVFMRDTNNNNRRSLAAAGFTSITGVPDYSGDLTYLWQANTSGVAASQNVTTAVNTCNIHTLGDAATGRWDYRSKNGNTTDVFDFGVWSYGHLFGDISNQSLVGTGTLTVAWILFNDTYVTLSEAAAVTKLGDSFTVDRATNTITVTANSTLDDLYDALKAYKTRPGFARLEYPSIKVQPVRASGTTATTDMAIVVNAGVTLSAGAKLKTLTTTGAVTNNGSITAIYTSSTGTSAKLALSGLSGAAVAVYDNNGAEVAYSASVTGTFTRYIAPGMTGEWKWVVSAYGYKTASGTFTPGSGGEFGQTVVLVPDLFVVASQSAASVYTDLTTPQKIYDYLSYWHTTQAGIAVTPFASISALGITLSPYNVVQDATAAALVAVSGGALTYKATTVTGSQAIYTSGTYTLSNGATITAPYQASDGLRARINGLDPAGLGTTWVFGWIKTSDYNASNLNNAPATWAGWNQSSGTGNSTQVALAVSTEYQLFLRIPGYYAPIGPIATIDTATQTSVTISPVVDTDLMGSLLWSQTSAHSTQAAKFSYNLGAQLVEYDNSTGATEYITFLAAYRALELIAKAPAMAYMLIEPLYLNGTKDGFTLPRSNPLVARMSTASTAGAILEADISYADDQAKAFDRFRSNAAHTHLLIPQVSASLTSSTVAAIKSGLATRADAEVINNGIKKSSLLIPHVENLP